MKTGLLLITALVGGAFAAEVTPVQKVIEMMTAMKLKGEEMKETEAKVFAEYQEWVDDETKEHGFEIQTATSDIEKLTAFIVKAESDSRQLKDAIQDLDDEIDRLTAEKKESTTVREKEHAEYEKARADYASSVDALGRAIQELSAQDYSRPQAEAFLQKMAKSTPGMGRVLAAFVQEGTQSEGDGAPAVAAYKPQTGGIVELLEGLETKFKKELDEVESQETNKAHYYDLEMVHLTDTIAKCTSDREEKSVSRSKTMDASAKAKGELAETKAAKAEDEKYVQDMQATFATKSETNTENQKVRTNELEALSKAIEIMSSPAVQGSLAQVASKAPASFLQVRRSGLHASAQHHAAAFLQDRAKSLSSRILLAVAAQAAAPGNPFEKVVSMIEGLIDKLKEEAAAEADHKKWCDEQLKTNKLKRDKKSASVEKLSAEIEGLEGDIETMAEDIATLLKEQSELTQAMKKATEQRESEKAANTKAIADAQAGDEATKQAIVVLREFYSSQAAFLQARQAPEMSSYKGMQAGKGGVIGMLEVVQSDFARLNAETKAAETAAVKEYDEFMEDATADKTAKHDKEVKLKLDKDQAEFDKSQLDKDLKVTQKELTKANEYFEYLKPSCLEVKVSYEDRVARRKEEIEALQEAYKIINSKGE